MEYSQEQITQAGYAMKASGRAIQEGYVFASIHRNVGAAVHNLMIGGVVGVVTSFGLIAAGSAGDAGGLL
jgi:hypothetical protein